MKEANDHEVKMSMNQLESIFKTVQELEDKIAKDGFEERDIPAWIQSHITSAYEYLKQANDGFHELEEGAMGEVTLPTATEVGSGDVPAGNKDEEEKRMKHLKKFESFINEEYDGNMSDFKYEFPEKFEEATGNSQKAIKKISKKGKNGFEVRTSTYMSEPEMKSVGDLMGVELVSYEKDNRVAITLYESIRK